MQYRNTFALGIQEKSRLLHKGMRMPTQNDINAFGFRRQFLVANPILNTKTEVGKTNNDITPLFCP